MKYRLLLFVIIICSTNSYGTNWIILNNDSKKSSFDKLIKVENDTLIVELTNKITGIPIENIQKITYKSIYRYEAALGGCAVGGIVGLVLGSLVLGNELGGTIGMATGTIVGFTFFKNLLDKRFDLSKMSKEEKIKIIKSIITIYNE